MKRSVSLLLALTLVPSAAGAQAAQLSAAIEAGQVGERYDGYMGFAAVPPEPIRRQVNAINLRRRNLYIELGMRRNVGADVVGLTTACSLLAQLPVGEAYMLKDGEWRRRTAGQPAPVADHCR
jgi:uncharacterized protein YdbL (DUF1318 family)